MDSNAHIYAADEVNALVLDVGAGSTKAGFAGEDAPKVSPFHPPLCPSGERPHDRQYLLWANTDVAPSPQLHHRESHRPPFGSIKRAQLRFYV